MQITWDRYRSICSAIKCLLEITADDYLAISNGAVYDAIQAPYIVLRILGYLRVSCLPSTIICLLPFVYLSVCFVHVTVCASVQLKRGSRNFCQWGGGGSRTDCQKTVLTLFLVLNIFYSFYRGCPMVISKKTIIFHGFRGGGQHLPGGSNFFQGGPNANFYRTHITCNFPGGSKPPITPLDPHMRLEIHSAENTNKITDVQALTCTTFHFIFSFYCFFI